MHLTSPLICVCVLSPQKHKHKCMYSIKNSTHFILRSTKETIIAYSTVDRQHSFFLYIITSTHVNVGNAHTCKQRMNIIHQIWEKLHIKFLSSLPINTTAVQSTIKKKQKKQNTSMNRSGALDEKFLHYHKHGLGSLFWVSPTHNACDCKYSRVNRICGWK